MAISCGRLETDRDGSGEHLLDDQRNGKQLNSVRISFVGPGLSGRRESLSRVLQHFLAPQRVQVLDNDDRYLVANDSRVVTAVASKRSLFGDRKNPAVVEELRRLTSSSVFIFVVDSQSERVPAGTEQLNSLREDLALHGVDLDRVPIVFQISKRDIIGALPVAELRDVFKSGWCSYTETVASRGLGVLQTFETALLMATAVDAPVTGPKTRC